MYVNRIEHRGRVYIYISKKMNNVYCIIVYCHPPQDPDAYPFEAPSLLPVAVSGIVASLSLISLLLLTIAAVIFLKFT